MTHLAGGPTVSLEEAQRIENETADYLIKSRRLSLIVDLDQTIVHATVDPTVGEWIAEGEMWEARRERRERREQKRREKAMRAKDPEDEDDEEEDSDSSSDDSDSEEDEGEVNPNWEALKDVKKFRLAPDNFGASKARGSIRGKERRLENEGCMYYVKPRYVPTG